ncbi:receptor L domain-containing protein [Hanstruepera ponticola]|uniref:hypothetical protein n=1 Tax=Hanstruepera ponticola TaxID=2042995 RepID=UPI00178736AC|nr:hypothetical protein [Hanstruepera ponticola]
MTCKTKFFFFGKLLLIVTLFFNCSNDDDNNSVAPQTPAKVFEGNVVLSSQAAVEDFGSENYDEIDGSVFIGFSNQNESDITNLDALISIESIQYGLTIQNNPLLNSLSGLNGLTFINGGALTIKNNESLTTTGALSGLLSFKSLLIEDNPVLLNVNGLEGVRLSRESIIITNNVALTNIDGLAGLVSVEGEILFIAGNTSLSSINGLSNLQFVTGDLVIRNSLVTNLNALESLEEVDGGIFVSYNESLTNFCGLLPLIDSGGLGGSFSTKGNGYDPTIDDLNTDSCSI